RRGADAAHSLRYRTPRDNGRLRAAARARSGDSGEVRVAFGRAGALAGRVRGRRRQGGSVRGPGARRGVRGADRRQLHQCRGPAASGDAVDAGGGRRGAAVDVAAGLSRVRERIAAACLRAGRDPASVRLIAVSKTKPIEMLREAVAAGQAIFGENYAQELRENGPTLLEEVRALPALACEGLMCILPAEGDPRPCFRLLRQLGKACGLPQLSMGMSADYEAAIEEGATLVRVGTAIFGERAP